MREIFIGNRDVLSSSEQCRKEAVISSVLHPLDLLTVSCRSSGVNYVLVFSGFNDSVACQIAMTRALLDLH